jgi:membrane protein
MRRAYPVAGELNLGGPAGDTCVFAQARTDIGTGMARAPSTSPPVIGAVARRVRAAGGQLRHAFAHHDVLTYASAMAFHILIALPPLLLLLVAMIGFFDVSEAWSQDVAPSVRGQLSPEAFAFIDHTVRSTLLERQAFWLTAGAALAIWEISAVVRAVMGALNLIYSRAEQRGILRRFAVSLWLALAVAALLVITFVVVRFGPLLAEEIAGRGWLVDVVSFVARWALAASLLLAVVSLLLRFAPAARVPWHWIGEGSLLVIGAWIVMSLGFGAYVTSVVDYETIFGNLALLFGLMTYVYLGCIAFLAGVELDALRADRPTPERCEPEEGAQRRGRDQAAGLTR